MALLDTSVAIGLRDRTEDIWLRVARLSGRPQISLLTLVELEGGVVTTPILAAERRVATDLMLRSLRVLPCDKMVVSAYSHILAAAGFSRRKIIDRLIAATAIVHDLTLVTMNPADFADIPDLRLEVWPAQ